MANADTLKGADAYSGNAFDGAKVQQNFETTKDKEQKRAMETASVSHDEEHQHAVISFADGAKVRIKLVLYQLLWAKLDIMSTFT